MAEYIEREAFKAEIRRLSTHYLNEWDTLGVLAAADRIPAADVREVKRSHWFDGACVNCGFKPALDYEYETVYDKWNGYAWNFCPNCGAMMEES